MRDVGYASVARVPDPHRGDIEVREEPQDETGAADGEPENEGSNLSDEGRANFQIERVYEAPFDNLDEVPGGFALPDPDDIESFGAAGMTNRPHTLTSLQQYVDGQGNYIEDRLTFHTHGDGPECPFAWDMDYDNDSDEE
jgi:hypothetical protein